MNKGDSSPAVAAPFDPDRPSRPATHFRKKPVVIEAWQFKGIPNKEGPPPEWLMAAVNSAFDDGEKVPGTTLTVGGVVSNFRDQRLDIGTLEGVMKANVGDWIIRGVKGELSPCKPDIFAATYEAVDVVATGEQGSRNREEPISSRLAEIEG